MYSTHPGSNLVKLIKMNNFNPPNPRDFPEREKEMFISDKVFKLMCSLAKGGRVTENDCNNSNIIVFLKSSIVKIYNLDKL